MRFTPIRALLVATALGMLLPSAALAQNAPKKFLSAASTNSTLVQTGKVWLGALVAVNTTATIYYLKLYDKATAPTCGTDVPKWTVPVLATSSAPVSIPSPLVFNLGLGFCLTGAIADGDVANAAVGVSVNFGLSGRL